MAHSNQIREVLITDRGIQLLDVPVSSGEVRMGAARVALEAREREEERERRVETDRKKRLLERKRLEKEARIATIEAEFNTEAENLKKFLEEGKNRREAVDESRRLLGRIRKADPNRSGNDRKKNGAPKGGR
jgi:circadian clock protein KaiC